MGLIAWLMGKPDAVAARPGTREAAWEAAFRANTLPAFVASRLQAVGTGAAPWTSTGNPAELLLIRRNGMRPVALVSGTCWFKCGEASASFPYGPGAVDYRGQATVTGWHLAVARIQAEAREAGAHIVVDVRLRSAIGDAGSHEYTLAGTALRVESVDPSPFPLLTTLSGAAALRALWTGIVPAGIAVGSASRSTGVGYGARRAAPRALDGRGTLTNMPLPELTDLHTSARNAALASLKQAAGATGYQLLAHDISGDIERVDRGNAPPAYVAHYTAIATVIDAPRDHGTGCRPERDRDE